MKSTEIIEPTAFSQPVAAQGSRNEIPQNATGSNLASIAEGFPDVTMIAPADGGLPPFGQDFNGLFYLTTTQWVYLQNGGFITFNQNVSDAIGGYPQGAILGYINSEDKYRFIRSIIDDNTYNFVETPDYINNEYWEELPPETSVEWGSITGTLSNQTDLQNELNSLQTNIDTNMSDNGLYITTYISGTSGYREYFSDTEKTERILLEQWGYQSGTETNYKAAVTLYKEYSNTSYCINITMRQNTEVATFYGGNVSSLSGYAPTTTSFNVSFTNTNLTYGFYWHTIGI